VRVDSQGNVANLRVIQGHPLLDQAAIDAVRQWRYSPTYINGKAAEVLATVSVPFVLSSDSSSRLSNSTTITGVLNETPASKIQGGIIGEAPTGGANPAVKPPQREPLRVGGNVQESKIIKKVEPVYPELAKRARIEQIVMLEVTVNEEGLVSNIRVIRGHPLLEQAAIDAVKQWVYAPTLLNGEAVPVVATVTVIFSLSARFTLDADEYIRDANGAVVSIATLRETQGSILIAPNPQTSFDQIQQTLAYLQVQGVENVRLNSQSFAFASGRLFYLAPSVRMIPGTASFVSPTEIPRTATEIPRNMDGTDPTIQAPVLDIDSDQLVKMAESSGRLPNVNSGLAFATLGLNFTVYVDEAGQIVAVQGPGGSLDIPEVTAALRAARVTKPGLRGNVPVPVALRISLRVTLK
jgi:TonB family protein